VKKVEGIKVFLEIRIFYQKEIESMFEENLQKECKLSLIIKINKKY